MRRGSKPKIILGENDAVLGVNLSADYCAEHEWGIDKLKEAFGIPTVLSAYGIARRQVTIRPKTLEWVKYTKDKREHQGFIYRPYFYGPPVEILKTSGEIATSEGSKFFPTPTTLASAWSEDDFAVVSTLKDEIKFLKEIYDAFDALDIVIMFSGVETPFENPGLVIGIASRIPQEFLDLWYKADKDWHKVKKEVAASGIEELLRQAGKKYFALSPRRQEDGSIKFWLNPYEQKENNFGWYTLDDLKLWIVNEGPIPMKKETVVH